MYLLIIIPVQILCSCIMQLSFVRRTMCVIHLDDMTHLISEKVTYKCVKLTYQNLKE